MRTDRFVAMAVQYVQWQGSGPISFEVPSRGKVYKFKPGIRNKVDSEVWKDLVDPETGAARLYFEKKLLRLTTPTGGTDVEEVAGVSRAIAPVPPAPPPSQDAKLREENIKLRAEVVRLSSRLDAFRLPEPAVDVARQDEQPEQDGQDSDPSPGETEEPKAKSIDTANMSVDVLVQAIKGMSIDELEVVLTNERAGKARKGAITAIEAEQNRALERDEG